MAESTATPENTSIEVIANVSRIVTKVVDRITGDRVDFPLLVAAATVEALRLHGVESRVMFGQAAWVEVLEDHSIVWAGCWGQSLHFWVATQHGEVVDLNVGVAHRKRSHQTHQGVPMPKPMYSPPILWSHEVPSFYRYRPEGVAEVEVTEERDKKWLDQVLVEVREKCGPAQILGKDPEFPNEAILCPGRRLLDDSKGNFKMFDRALSVKGIPEAPF